MLNRRHIRVKVMQSIYAMHQNGSDSIEKEEKFLLFSIENILDLYLIMLSALASFAQDGNQGITEAANKVKGYFDTGTDLMYAIGAVVGLVGAVKVYSKWNAGEPDTGKVATAWFGSCIFLVVVATVLQSFFGI